MSSTDPREHLIVALDAGPEQALSLAASLRETVSWVKVGMTLFYQAGPSVVAELREMGFDVFIDLKLHDIPHQVSGAARALATLGAGMITVHAGGGTEMVAAAVRGAHEGADSAGVARPSILAVTVLTSLGDQDLTRLGIGRSSAQQVDALARLATEAGADGVVCSPLEASAVSRALAPGGLVVTPGVRPEGIDRGDQSRVATPVAALASGATHLVVGRPITESDDPGGAAKSILAEMEGSEA